MISKNDIIILLTEYKDRTGEDVSADIKSVLSSKSIPLNVLKKINDNRQLDVRNFYEKLRKSYNNKKSKLYINIMHADENLEKDPKTALTTLAAIGNQILQFKADDIPMFYKHSRLTEIYDVLKTYSTTYNIDDAYKLLTLIKADIVVLEGIAGKREI